MSSADAAAGARLHRSYLYAPGSRPEVMAKALASDADAVILDLEDAVAPQEKVAARRQVAVTVAGVADDPVPAAVHVRINRVPGGFDRDDVLAVVGPGLDALRLPKVADPAELVELDELLSDLESESGLAPGAVKLYPIIESAAGLVALDQLAKASDRLVRVAFGSSDYLADIGATDDDGSSEPGANYAARCQLVLGSRAALLGPPVDSVHTRLNDLEGLRRAALSARRLGMFGKSIIHPRQIAPVHEAFTPRPAELEWAQRVCAALDEALAADDGVAVVDGEFVDAAITARARGLLSLASPQELHHVRP